MTAIHQDRRLEILQPKQFDWVRGIEKDIRELAKFYDKFPAAIEKSDDFTYMATGMLENIAIDENLLPGTRYHNIAVEYLTEVITKFQPDFEANGKTMYTQKVIDVLQDRVERRPVPRRYLTSQK